MLVAKELRLQQVPLVIAGLSLLLWIVLVLRADSTQVGFYRAFAAVSGLLLAMVIGSIASAEERQLGTIEWQVVQPVAMWQQWSVKVGVVMGLAMILGVGVPTALTDSSGILRGSDGHESFGTTVVMLTAASLYVSSLCASGAWALVMSLPAVAGGLFVRIVALGPLGKAADAAWSSAFKAALPAGTDLRGWTRSEVMAVADPLVTAGFIAVVAWFALENHRSTDRSVRVATGWSSRVRRRGPCGGAGGIAMLFGRRW
jgi:hypothetical protein